MIIRVVTHAADRSTLSGRMCRSLASLSLAATLAACGGSGGDDPAPEPEPPPVPVPVATTLTGTAATGAPFAGAAVQVVDAAGTTVCETTTVNDGSYTCPLAPTAQRPLVIRAAKDETVLYSATAAAGDARANVTPLTHIIVSRLAPNGNAAELRSAIQTLTADALKAQSDALVAALQPLLAALNLNIDPLAGALIADGTGQDKLLDTIAVTVRPDGAGANVEITVKTIPNSSGEPVSIQFRTNDSAIPALSSTEVTAATVANVPAPSVVADLFTRMTACYALPLSQRVNAPNDTAAVTGGPADVIAPQCRTLFVNDDPATYLSTGSRVGRNAANAGSFSGLFRPGATGVVYHAYNVEFFRGNAQNDMVISAYWQSPNGERANDQYVARNVNGTLKLIGNQYAYPSAVRPFTEDREFLNTPQFSYYNTGYNIRVNNWTDSNGNPIFRKVLVTPPWGGNPITLLPGPGQLLLSISPDGVTQSTTTSILRLGSAYRDTTLVADAPHIKDGGAAVGAPISDGEIAALSNQGQWTFEFFFTDTSQPNVIQRNRTLSRPYTVAEIRQTQFASLTASARADLIAESAATGAATFTAPDVAAVGDATTPAWTVPANGLAPSSVSVFGRAPFGSTTAGVAGNRYDDFVSVASTARHATVLCSAQTASDKHCDAGGQGRYATGTSVYLLELWGLNDRQMEISKKAALYKLQ